MIIRLFGTSCRFPVLLSSFSFFHLPSVVLSAPFDSNTPQSPKTDFLSGLSQSFLPSPNTQPPLPSPPSKSTAPIRLNPAFKQLLSPSGKNAARPTLQCRLLRLLQLLPQQHQQKPSRPHPPSLQQQLSPALSNP